MIQRRKGGICVKILFAMTGKAFLPEIDAYVKYFNKLEGFEAYDSQLLDENYSIDDFDVIWEFKGFAEKGCQQGYCSRLCFVYWLFP